MNHICKGKLRGGASVILSEVFVTIVLSIVAFLHPVYAQIIPDNTLGNERSRVNRNIQVRGGNADRIEGGATRGSNLFHSFREFNVGEEQRVYFDNPNGVENILTRVTGRDISDIHGTLGVDGAANLFLLNPNGIIFGPNAQLDVRGSFLATTANSFVFADNQEFSATNPPSPPLLTVSVPTGLQFGRNPGNIINRSIATIVDTEGNPAVFDGTTYPGGLQVPPDRTLALVGGNIYLQGGNLYTASGRIELGSVASLGQVSLTSIDEGWSLGYENIRDFGNIELTEGPLVETSGSQAVNRNVGGGGAVHVQAGRLTLLDASQILSMTEGTQSGQDLTIHASESIYLDGASSGFSTTTVGSVKGPGSAGSAGNIIVSTRQLELQNGASINSVTSFDGDGQSGSLRVRALESLILNEVGILNEVNEVGGSSLFTQTISESPTGKAGNVRISTEHLVISDGAVLGSATMGAARAGDLFINANSVEVTGVSAISNPFDEPLSSRLYSQTFAIGRAGDITIRTRQLRTRDGGAITSTTFGIMPDAGHAGNITVRATDIDMSGVVLLPNDEPQLNPEDLPFPGGLFSGPDVNATGAGGTIDIETQRLRLSDGAVLQSATYGSGDAGDLIVRADDFIEVSGTSRNNISPTGIIAYSGGIPGSRFQLVEQATGRGGDLRIDTRELTVQDGAVVAVSSINQQAEAGQLWVQSQNVLLDDGQLTAASAAVDGGNIALQAQDELTLQNTGEISARAGAGGNGGNIIISAGAVNAVPEEDNDIIARAYRGQGGNIIIVSRDISGFEERQATPGNGTNDIDASSEFGESGTVITTSVLVPDELVSVDFSNPELAQGCQVEGGVASAEFFNTGRGGVPPSPYDPLSNDDVLDDVRLPIQQSVPSEDTDSDIHASSAVSLPSDRIVEAQRWIVNDKGQVVLMAEAPDPQLATECQLR